MHNSTILKVFKGSEELIDELGNFTLAEIVVLHDLGKLSVLNLLHDDVDVIVCLEYFFGLHYVWM